MGVVISEDEAVAENEEVVEDDNEMQQNKWLDTKTSVENGSGDVVIV